jgi:hypothetical protein
MNLFNLFNNAFVSGAIFAEDCKCIMRDILHQLTDRQIEMQDERSLAKFIIYAIFQF